MKHLDKEVKAVEFRGKKYPAHFEFFAWAFTTTLSNNEVIGVARASSGRDIDSKLVWKHGVVIQKKL